MSDPETNKLLSEILKWQRLQGIQTVRKLIPEMLDVGKKKIAYEMTDGKNSQADIAKRVGIATGTVSNWWNQWHAWGIVIKDGVKYKRVVSLKELGKKSQKKNLINKTK